MFFSVDGQSSVVLIGNYEERYRERVLRALSPRAAKLGMQMVPMAAVEQPA